MTRVRLNRLDSQWLGNSTPVEIRNRNLLTLVPLHREKLDNDPITQPIMSVGNRYAPVDDPVGNVWVESGTQYDVWAGSPLVKMGEEQSIVVPDYTTDDELAAHAALETGTHGIPSMSNGQGLLWNGSDWVATDMAVQAELDAHTALTGTAHMLPVVSTLPGVPVNGQEVIYQTAAMTTAGRAWRFKYVAATPGSFKWVFLGGPPIIVHDVGGSAVNGGDVYWDFSPASTILTVPLAGYYTISAVVELGGPVSAAFIWRLGLQQSGSNYDIATIAAASQGGASFSTVVNRTFETSAVAGAPFRIIYRLINVGYTTVYRTLSATPIVVG